MFVAGTNLIFKRNLRVQTDDTRFMPNHPS